jgi:hypothetical protein
MTVSLHGSTVKARSRAITIWGQETSGRMDIIRPRSAAQHPSRGREECLGQAVAPLARDRWQSFTGPRKQLANLPDCLERDEAGLI